MSLFGFEMKALVVECHTAFRVNILHREIAEQGGERRRSVLPLNYLLLVLWSS
jgi:hypothetical protein